MEDVPKEVASGLLARLRNPVLASFLISWSVYNWKVFVHLLTGASDPMQRIAQVTAQISTGESWLYPLLFAGAYTVLAQWVWLLVSLYSDLATSVRERKNAAIRRNRLEVEADLTTAELEITRNRRSLQEFKDEETKLKERVATVFAQLRDDIDVRLRSEQDLAKSNLENATQKLRLDIESLVGEAKLLTDALKDQQSSLEQSAATVRRWMSASESERAVLFEGTIEAARRQLEHFNATLLDRQKEAAEAMNEQLDALLAKASKTVASGPSAHDA